MTKTSYHVANTLSHAQLLEAYSKLETLSINRAREINRLEEINSQWKAKILSLEIFRQKEEKQP